MLAGDVSKGGLELNASERSAFQAILDGKLYAPRGPQKLLLIRLNEHKRRSQADNPCGMSTMQANLKVPQPLLSRRATVRDCMRLSICFGWIHGSLFSPYCRLDLQTKCA